MHDLTKTWPYSWSFWLGRPCWKCTPPLHLLSAYSRSWDHWNIQANRLHQGTSPGVWSDLMGWVERITVDHIGSYYKTSDFELFQCLCLACCWSSLGCSWWPTQSTQSYRGKACHSSVSNSDDLGTGNWLLLSYFWM